MEDLCPGGDLACRDAACGPEFASVSSCGMRNECIYIDRFPVSSCFP